MSAIGLHHSMASKNSSGYQLEYIDVGGYCFITDFLPNNKSSFECAFAFINQGYNNRGLFSIGSRNDWQRDAFLFSLASPIVPGIWLQYGSQTKNVSRGTVTLYEKYIISFTNSRSFIFNGRNLWTANSQTFQVSCPFTINETMAGGDLIESTVFCEARFYYSKIWDNETLVRHFVPWMDKKEGLVVKDLVSGKNFAPTLTSNQKYERYLIPGPVLET